MKKKFNPQIDYYKVLGVGQEFTDEALKKAYRRRALETHPDISSDKSSDTFREVGEAYEVLSNPDLKTRYDFERKELLIRLGNALNQFFKKENSMAEERARKEFYQKQKESYEREDRAEQERAEKEARERMKEKIRLNKLWKDGMDKVLHYIIRFPSLRDKFLQDSDWFRDNFAYGFGRDGTIFYKDLGILNSLLSDTKKVTGEEIYKLALETRDREIINGKIPLANSQIKGLELLVTIGAPTKRPYVEPKYEDFVFNNATIRLNYSNVPYCRDDFCANTPLPIDFQKPNESLMQIGNFIAHLNNEIRGGNYLIGLSEDVPKKHSLYKSVREMHSLNAHGFWITSLFLGRDEVIRDGEVVNLPNGLPLIV